jgi:membrane peptidoglycan carboxypeptidase
VIASNVNRDLTMMLYGVVTQGTGRSAALPGREVAGKTGTTQDYRDAWFVGFTPDYVTGVWVGNDDNSPMRNVTGGTLPATIWKDVMTFAERGLPPKALDKSPSEQPVDTETVTASTDEETNAAPSSSDDESTAQSQSDSDSASAPAKSLRTEHRSFWDWLTGGGDDDAQAGQPQRDTSNAPPPRGEDSDQPEQRIERYPPRDEYARPERHVEHYPPRVAVSPPPDRAPRASVPPPGEANADEPPVRDPDNELGPPVRDPEDQTGPPIRDPDSGPPPIVRHRPLPPPPPPPPPPDDDGN